jgi:TRAP-type C4-dicarboxylate transport system substrate-binding protein
VIYSNKYYEVLDYVAVTNHLVEYVLWVVGDHVWSTLSDADKECMQAAVDTFGKNATDVIAEQEDSLQKLMSENGWVTFTHPDAAEFQKLTAPIIEAGIADGKWSQEIVDRIRALKATTN